MTGQFMMIFFRLMKNCGVFILSIGLLRITIKKCGRFNSKYWCPGTEAIDAFTQVWKSENNWLFPPPSIIPKVINGDRKGFKYFDCSRVEVIAVLGVAI